MKKYTVAFLIFLFAQTAWAEFPGYAPGPLVKKSDCSVIRAGACLDVDDGLIYTWNGSAVVQVTAESAAITVVTADADTNPGVNDDTDTAAGAATPVVSGYSPGDLWINDTADPTLYWICISAADGAAVWQELTGDGTFEPADATIIKEAEVDDTPVDGVTTEPVSSNWAYDHDADADAHVTVTAGDGIRVDDPTTSTPDVGIDFDENTTDLEGTAVVATDVILYMDSDNSDDMARGLVSDLPFQDEDSTLTALAAGSGGGRVVVADGDTNPGVNDDIDTATGAATPVVSGYLPGDIWINDTASPALVYQCISNADGAAVWQELTGDGTFLPTQTIGIANDNLVEVDGTPVDGEVTFWTALGLDSKNEAEFKSVFNLEAGTDFISPAANANISGLFEFQDDMGFMSGNDADWWSGYDTSQSHYAMKAVVASGSLIDENPFAAADVTLTVDDGTDFYENCFIKIESEFLKVTGIAGNNLTVTRAQLGSTDVEHAENTAINLLKPYWWLSATGAGVASSGTPGFSAFDSDAVYTDTTFANIRAEQLAGRIYWNLADTGEATADADIFITGVVANADTTHLDYDQSDAEWDFQANAITTTGIASAGTVISNYTIVTPQAYSASADANVAIGTALTSSVVLATAADDGNDETLDLQDGTVAGQILTIIAIANVDVVNDALIIDAEADSTCTGCPDVGIFTLETEGSSVTLYWTGSVWIYIGSTVGE